MLKMPYEDPANSEDFKPLGPPIKKQKQPEYDRGPQPTGTPGILKDPKTGKLSTDFPENEKKFVPLTDFPIRVHKEYIECLQQSKSSPIKEKNTFVASPGKDSSAPQQSGKSLTEEISLPSGFRIRYSRSSQELPKLVFKRGKSVEMNKIRFRDVPAQVAALWYDADSGPWAYVENHVIAIFCDGIGNWYQYK